MCDTWDENLTHEPNPNKMKYCMKSIDLFDFLDPESHFYCFFDIGNIQTFNDSI